MYLKSRYSCLLALLLTLGADLLFAQSTNKVIESTTAVSALPKLKLVTANRIAKLPDSQRVEWEKYIVRSEAGSVKERLVLAMEMAEMGLFASRPAPSNSKEFELGAKVENGWLLSPEASSLADVVLSYQTPSGGWSKAVNYAAGPRPKGTHWTTQSGLGWHYCGTLDNRSTTEQIRFLAYVYGANPRAEYRDSAVRGLQWLLDAQFPNGGWPQVYPLEPGYHEAITLNDNAMTHAIQLLLEAGSGRAPFEFVEGPLRASATAAAKKGIECLIDAQIVIDGKACVWCAQHDPLTLEPVAARLKEPPSLSGGESAELVKFLMREAPDTPATRKAIEAAVTWFAEHKITGLKTTKNAKGKTDYVADPTSTEIMWARFYDLETQLPIFAGADDGIIYASFGEMAQKNKVGYNYFTTRPQDLITKEFVRWKKRIGKD